METRASHILVGSFVMLCIAGLVAFAIWVAKVDLEATYKDYDIIFEGSVSGLVNRGTVFYNGIPVGNVQDINLDPNDPSRVRVWIRVRTEVPVTEDSVARLEFQGFTGVAFIDLGGGSPNAPALTAHAGQERPVIPSEASSFQALFNNTPELLATAIDTLERVQALLNDEAIGGVTASIQNVEVITANVAAASADLPTIVKQVEAMVAQVTETASAIEALSRTGEALLDDEARTLIAEATETLDSANALMVNINALVANNEPAITQFINSSLPEVSRMIRDLRITGRALSRLVTRIERNPGEVIFGGEQEEYDLKTRKKEPN